jgi:D-aminopeptidase
MPAEGRKRARDFGIPFAGTPGPLNAITDVPGVEVGYTTLIEGEGPLRVGHGPVRTGVTAILPHGHDGAGGTAAAGWHSLNGNGEMTGTAWIEESGALTVAGVPAGQLLGDDDPQREHRQAPPGTRPGGSPP